MNFSYSRQAKNSANELSSGVTKAGGKLGAKKMVIKPFKVQPKVAENFGMETWQKLKSALTAVYSKQTTNLSKEELYRAVEDLCIQKMSAKIYELLSVELEKFIHEKVNSLLNQTADLRIFLKIVDGVWKDHLEQLNTVRNIFLYLDRSFALQNQGSGGPKLIWVLGNEIFRKRLESLPQILNKLITAELSAIDRFRQGESEDSEVFGRIAQMFITLGSYSDLLEPPFLQDSQRFYSHEGNQLISSLDSSHFLTQVDKRMVEATEMTKKYLHPRTQRPLLETIETFLLKPHLQQLVERGLQHLLMENRRSDLRRMYLLFKRVDACLLVQQGWVFYIRSQGEALISGPNAEKTFVEDVLRFQDKLWAMLKDSFYNDDGFKTSLKSSFEHFLNLKAHSAAEKIARFVDKKLRTGGISTSSSSSTSPGNNSAVAGPVDVDQCLDQVMKLFKHLQEKDLFEAFYKKHLSKRLLLGKSASYELERSMLGKLKAECGASFTSKLEGMFQDVELSRECQTAFQLHQLQLRENSTQLSTTPTQASAALSGFKANKNEPEMSVQVLTTGYWPLTSVVSEGSMDNGPAGGTTEEVLRIPSEIVELMERFNSFYVQKYQGRRLRWDHSQERCILTARFPKGKKDLEVSLYQAIVLKCFNTQDQITFEQLRSLTGIEIEALRRTLQSLACGLLGTRVLSKQPKGKDVLDSDTFFYNSEFSNKLFRIKINSIQVKETAEEVQRTHEEVFREREYQVDAAIVRIMKARKRLPHTQLIGELLQQLRFPARPQDLKRRVESLIERDYLERDAQDGATYNYLA